MSIAKADQSFTLPATDSHLAGMAQKQLAKIQNTSEPIVHVELTVTSGNQAESVRLPTETVGVLAQALAEMAQGSSVAVVPVVAELSTQQAADLLSVSRPHLIELLERGAIPYHKVGSHRRVQLRDVLQYKREIDERRLQTLAELTAQAQELNMGY